MARKPAADVVVDESEDPAEMQRLAEQFRGLVKAVGGPTQAAKVLKRGINTVHSWTAGKTKIPFLVVLRLAQEADLSLDTFAAGEEAIASSRTVRPLMPGQPLDPPVIEGPPPEGYVELQLLDVTASAGSGTFALGGPSGSIAARESWLRAIGAHPTKTEALTARGDSMEPTIRDGDLLLVDRSIDRIQDDAVYVVTVFGAVKVKRVTRRTDGSVILSSDNPRHPPETVPRAEVNDVLTIEGRVRWCGRLM